MKKNLNKILFFLWGLMVLFGHETNAGEQGGQAHKNIPGYDPSKPVKKRFKDEVKFSVGKGVIKVEKGLSKVKDRAQKIANTIKDGTQKTFKSIGRGSNKNLDTSKNTKQVSTPSESQQPKKPTDQSGYLIPNTFQPTGSKIGDSKQSPASTSNDTARPRPGVNPPLTEGMGKRPKVRNPKDPLPPPPVPERHIYDPVSKEPIYQNTPESIYANTSDHEFETDF
jgi:hypothetical protein